VPGFSGKFINGVTVEDGGTTYLYLGFYDNWIYIYRVDSAAGGLINLVFVQKSPIRASMARGKGLAIDEVTNLAVSSFPNDDMQVWDISNPASPVQRSFVAGNLGYAAMRYPFAWVAQPVSADSSKTYNIEDPGNPVELDPAFWDPAQPWNDHSDPEYGDCEFPTGAVFAPDASVLFLARYSVIQAIDFTACARPDGEEPTGEEPDAGKPDGQGPDDPGQDEGDPDGWISSEDGAPEPADAGDPVAPADGGNGSSCACGGWPGHGAGLAVVLMLILWVRRSACSRPS